jgi:hypothetical protein
MGRMKGLALIALFAIACGATAAHAQTLSLGYKTGAMYKYSLHSTSDSTLDEAGTAVPLKFDITASELVEVTSVDSDGVATLEIGLDNITMKSAIYTTTTTTTSAPSQTIAMRVGKDGRIVSVNGTSLSGNPLLSLSPTGGVSFTSAVLPDNAVKPGDTWTKNYDQANTMGTGSVHVATNSNYLRDELLQGIKAAVVQTTSTVTFDITMDLSKLVTGTGTQPPTLPQSMLQGLTIKGTATSDTTSWIDPSGRRMLKTHMSGTTDAALTFLTAAGGPVTGMPGSFKVTGKETTDLTPA